MLELFGVPIGSAAQLVTALTAVTGLIWAILKFGLGWRGQSFGNEADIRDHYAAEVERLVEKTAARETHFIELEKHLRALTAASDKRHEECEQARTEDRNERRRMEGKMDEMSAEIAGLRRQIPEVSADKLLVLEGNGKPSEVAPHAAAAAPRVKKITEGK